MYNWEKNKINFNKGRKENSMEEEMEVADIMY